jgi:hypothetical protein
LDPGEISIDGWRHHCLAGAHQCDARGGQQ